MQIRITSSPAENVLGLNLLGLAIVAAFHPYTRVASSPVSEWLSLLVMVLGGAGVIYGLYSLIFRKRGREGWPKSFLMLAWFLMLASFFGAYRAKPAPAPQAVEQAAPQVAQPQAPAAPKHQSEIDRFLDSPPQSDEAKKAKPQYSPEIEEAMKNAPAYRPQGQ